MSEWHLSWQRRFPIENREVVVTRGKNKHRADVLIGKTVIEFQHSRISIDEFNARNNYYTGAGYQVIWVFDMRSESDDERILEHPEKMNHYEWKYHWHVFDRFWPKNDNIKLFFQLGGEFYAHHGKMELPLYRVVWFSPDRKHFCTEGCCFADEFVDSFMPKDEFCVKDIYDKIVASKDIRYPCFKVNGTEDEHECNCCAYFAYTTENYGCIYRFQDILAGWNQDTDKVLCIKRNKEGLITFIAAIKDGKKIEKSYTVRPPATGGKTIPDILAASSAFVVGVINIRTGVGVKIGNTVTNKKVTVGSENPIMGYLKNEKTGKYYEDRREIFYWDRPEWMLEWER